MRKRRSVCGSVVKIPMLVTNADVLGRITGPDDFLVDTLRGMRRRVARERLRVSGLRAGFKMLNSDRINDPQDTIKGFFEGHAADHWWPSRKF
jgi:hypothetical protein